MKIEAFSKADEEGVLRLYKEFNEDRIASGVGDAQYKYIEGEMPWSRTLTDEDCFTLVLKEKNIVLGFITVRIPQFNPFHKVGKLAEVDLIVVERKLRRKGIGSFLFNTAQANLKTLSVTHILLNVKVGNLPALNFWHRMGFKKVSDTEYNRSDGMKEKTVYMVKKV